MKVKLIFALFTLLTAIGCYYEQGDEILNCSIDPSNVKFSTTITTLFIDYGCIGCHGTIAPSDNIVLNTYAGTKKVVDNGKLYGAITHSNRYSPMPQGSTKMNECDIRKIKAWIDAGAPNN